LGGLLAQNIAGLSPPGPTKLAPMCASDIELKVPNEDNAQSSASKSSQRSIPYRPFSEKVYAIDWSRNFSACSRTRRSYSARFWLQATNISKLNTF